MEPKLLHRTPNSPMVGNQKGKWTSLIYLLSENYLKECFSKLNKNAAAGVDGVTISEYGENLNENICKLHRQMKAWQYKPQPSRTVKIPKGRNKFRKLGIPTVEDRMVQLGIKRILDEVFEPLFLDMSYGFRQGKSCHDALRAVNQCINKNPVSYILDADIEDFFGSVDHKLLMKSLEMRISDKNFLRLIGRFLKGGIIEDGKFAETDNGTPQGGIISPVLANLYLHYALDVWFRKTAKCQLKGFVELIRYADDFVVCFQFEDDVKLFQKLLEKRFLSIGLKLSMDKTKIVKFGRKHWRDWKNGGNKPETFEFLGFTHICGTTRRGEFKVEVKTSTKRLSSKLSILSNWLKKIRSRVKLSAIWKLVCSKVRGHIEYYGVTGNIQSLKNYHKIVVDLTFKWINRRSQRQSFNWEQYNRFLKFNPLPKPKIKHSLYKPFVR